jgi:putative Mg2+ transporter-C (MgtC) family protein
MDSGQQLDAVGLILLAALFSGIVGLNREQSDHPAGLRTHMFIGMATCVFTILSLYAFPGADRSRIAAYTLPGLGFIGAGAILKQRGNIHGLTTAAGIWATAGIGMTVGTGLWVLGGFVAILTWFIFVGVRHFEVRVLGTKEEDVSPRESLSGQTSQSEN